MNNQTVEQAAARYKNPGAFKDGAAWQLKQGINWISVKDRLPEVKEEYTPVLITDGKDFKIWYVLFSKLLKTGSFKTTHWAHLNPPQTANTQANDK